MSADPFLPQPEAPPHAGPRDPEQRPPFHPPHETKGEPPFAATDWRPPSRFGRLLSGRTLIVTLEVTSSALLIWILAPDEVRYQLRKQVRWLPWAARYASWWLRQEGW
jgi:hypothetical protein